MMEIQVIDVRLLPSHKATRAFCDVWIGNILIRDFRVYQPNGKPSVRNPFLTYRDSYGSLKFREIITLPSTAQTEVNAAILTAYFRRLKENEHGRTD